MEEFRLLGKVNKPIRRIVSLAPSLTETLFFLGLGERVVGVTEQCDFPPEAREREKIGSFIEPDLGKISRLKPDLILALGRIHEKFFEEASGGDLPLISLPSTKSVEDIFCLMEEIAKLAGEEEKGKSLTGSLRERLKLVKERVKPFPPPRVFRLMIEDPIVTPTSSSYQWDAIRLAGGKPMPLEFEEPYTPVKLEEILRFDPQVILSCGVRNGEKPRRRCPGCRAQNPPCQRIVEEIGKWEGWRETQAAGEGRIYPIPCELICRPGPRLVEGIELMSKLFHRGSNDRH